MLAYMKRQMQDSQKEKKAAVARQAKLNNFENLQLGSDNSDDEIVQSIAPMAPLA